MVKHTVKVRVEEGTKLDPQKFYHNSRC